MWSYSSIAFEHTLGIALCWTRFDLSGFVVEETIWKIVGKKMCEAINTNKFGFHKIGFHKSAFRIRHRNIRICIIFFIQIHNFRIELLSQKHWQRNNVRCHTWLNHITIFNKYLASLTRIWITLPLGRSSSIRNNGIACNIAVRPVRFKPMYRGQSALNLTPKWIQ